MTEALAPYESQALTVAPSLNMVEALALMSEQEFSAKLQAMKLAQKRIAMIQRELMDQDVDYGTIPGTPKPTLLKPGAERLAKFHGLVEEFDETVTLGDGVKLPHIRVAMICRLHLGTKDGPIVAQGFGAANSFEKRYRWREAQRHCPSCGAATIYKSKDGGWFCWAKRGGCGRTFKDGDEEITKQQLGMVENPDPWDAENTLLKMAAKRAYVDAALRATGTSGLFTQDVEDTEPPQHAAPPAPARSPIKEAIAKSEPVQEGLPQGATATPERRQAEARYLDAYTKARKAGMNPQPLMAYATSPLSSLDQATSEILDTLAAKA